MYIILSLILLVAAFLFVALYIWYLIWPVKVGVVTRADTWTQPANNVIGPRKRRRLEYQYQCEGKNQECGTARQSLFLANALSPKKQVGDIIKISVCRQFPSMTCPRRPGFEFCILLVWVIFLLGGALIGLTEFS